MCDSSTAPAPAPASSGMTIDIRPMIEDVSQVMTKHITTILSGVIGEYAVYKETHDTIMGLPCVRKLQERISDLEEGGGTTTTPPIQRSAAAVARDDEISQLQTAIAELHRYIQALESNVRVKSEPHQVNNNANLAIDEESVKLEIREEDENAEENGETCDDTSTACLVSTTHKNVIITNTVTVTAEDVEEEDTEDEDTAEEEATEEDAEEDAEAEVAEEDAEEEEAEEAEEEEAAEEEAEEEEAEEEEAEEEEVAEEEVAEEAEIEVSEVKIKGKTYFTTDAVNGIIYACVDDDVGDEVGVFKNGVAVFNKSKK